MRFIPLTEKTDTLLALFGLSFVVFGWFALSLTLSGLFLFPFVALGMTISAIMSTLILIKLLRRAPLDLRFVFLIAFFYAALIGYVSEPTVFSGRDQGSIAEAAYRLAHNHELAFSTPGSNSFFQIYGPGTALNFPGFAYTQDGYLLTQFPLGYTAWLGSFVSLFGLTGYAIGNALLLFLFLISLYALFRLFVHPYYALIGLTLALFSFLPAWFAKITLTENFGVFLFTFLVLNLILFFKEQKFIYFLGVFLPAALFAFTRIEGFTFLFFAVVIMLLHPGTRALIKSHPWKTLVIPGGLFLFFFLRDFFLNLPYYKMIGKALVKFLGGFGGGTVGTLTDTASLSLGSVFFLYGLLALFIIGLFGLFFFAKEKRFMLLVPAFMTLPVFLYLFHPSISPDHPWMLRRYLFSLYPTLLFSAVLCIALLFAKDTAFPLDRPRGKRLFFVSIIFSGLLLLQLPAWNMSITFAENRGLLTQVQSFAETFSDKDLILIDRGATGSGFAMLSGPMQFLFGKNAVYFFNPHDLDALDTSHFEHVYLLTPDDSQGRYAALFGERLIFKKSVTFSLEQFDIFPADRTATLAFPTKVTTETHNLLFQIY